MVIVLLDVNYGFDLIKKFLFFMYGKYEEIGVRLIFCDVVFCFCRNLCCGL